MNRTPLRYSGAGLSWALCIALLVPLALVSLFTFSPISTALAISIAFGAFVLRSRIWPQLSAFLAVFVFVTLTATAIVLIDENTRRDYWTNHRIAPHYPIQVAPWFNIGAAYYGGTESRATSFQRLRASDLSGDVLIKTEFYERRPGANKVRCDKRCIGLLTKPEVESVTIQPDPDIWSKGPKAIMPGFQPDALTYSIRDTDECKARWHNMDLAPRYDSREAFITALHTAFLRKERCVISRPMENRIGDSNLFDQDLRWRSYYPNLWSSVY